MPVVTGVLALFYVSTDNGVTYTKIGGQKDASLRIDVKDADATTKDSNGWEESIPTTKSWGIDLDALLLETDAGQTALYNALVGGSDVMAKLTLPGGGQFTGHGHFTGWNLSAPQDNSMPIKTTFKGTGPLTKA